MSFVVRFFSTFCPHSLLIQLSLVRVSLHRWIVARFLYMFVLFVHNFSIHLSIASSSTECVECSFSLSFGIWLIPVRDTLEIDFNKNQKPNVVFNMKPVWLISYENKKQNSEEPLERNENRLFLLSIYILFKKVF